MRAFATIIALAMCLLQINAFMSSTMRSTRLSPQMKLELVGASAPLGFFDPFGFSKGVSDETLFKYRESELKHGRVAMLAVLGWLTQERFHPFYEGKLSGNPLVAFGEVPPLGFVQIIAFIGLLEYIGTIQNKYQSGDFLGIKPLIDNQDDSRWVSIQTRELNNGRLAMFAILGEITHAAITGKGALEQLGI
uniref:Uncharacterized protein n=1 Tax=Chromulina nebulosa TaxID=96789 RepID=A0A7S0XDX1_9STRA|mmetsp:Transcript_367/g.321  ORF Transcript_367/g.321 Transcript_367/m.321 type:complete len:192 (+) Transcript_367:41-616(+)